MSLPQSLTLLPANATPLEQAMAAPMARFNQIPVPIDTLWDPLRCPEPLLPWLAWALSVDIWDDRWHIEKKRYVCAESFTLHRLKGTLEGIRRHVKLVDCAVVNAIVPPAKLFMGHSRTAAERRAFLERYPQLRVFGFRDNGAAGKAAFCRGAWGLEKTFFADAAGKPVFFPVVSDAAARLGKRAFLFEPRDGSEQPLTHVVRETFTEARTAQQHDEVRIPGRRGFGVFASTAAPRARSFYGGAKPGRVMSVRIDHSYTDRDERMTLRTVSPSLDPVEINPEQVAVRGTAAGVRFCGQPIAGHLMKSDAGNRLYDQLYLFDPERAIARNGAQQFIHGRFGMPAYNAEIEISVPGKRSRYHFDRFCFGHSKPADTVRLENARRAVKVSKSLRDKILIDTTTRRPARFGDGVQFGDNHTFGSLMRG